MNLKEWWLWNKPVIMTNKTKYRLLNKLVKSETDLINHSNWMVIRPMIQDMEKFRPNTWDQDKITFWQNYLKDNFEVKDE